MIQTLYYFLCLPIWKTDNPIPYSFDLEWSNTDLLVQSLLKIKIENTI